MHVLYKPYDTEIHQFKFPPIAVFEQIAKFSLTNNYTYTVYVPVHFACAHVCVCVYVRTCVCVRVRACVHAMARIIPLKFYETCNSDL